MLYLLRNKYVLFFLAIYLISLLLLYFNFQQPVKDTLVVFICVGVVFSLLAWLLVKDNSPAIPDRPAFNSEWIVLAGLVLFFFFYVTYGTGWINQLIPASVKDVAWKNDIAVTVKKLLVFVIIPFFIYKSFGFSVKDFGLRLSKKEMFNRKNFITFIVLSIAALSFQYFLSGGAAPVREGQFSFIRLLTGLPILFTWLFIEAGLVEEFFFRALLQSRIAVLLKSQVAGIVISGLIFGLAHAPGLYLRGAESEGVSESMPFYFWAAYTITAMSLAGIFLGIVWSRTKNLYLVMAIHAMVDLLPNTAEFFHTWGL